MADAAGDDTTTVTPVEAGEAAAEEAAEAGTDVAEEDAARERSAKKRKKSPKRLHPVAAGGSASSAVTKIRPGRKPLPLLARLKKRLLRWSRRRAKTPILKLP